MTILAAILIAIYLLGAAAMYLVIRVFGGRGHPLENAVAVACWPLVAIFFFVTWTLDK